MCMREGLKRVELGKEGIIGMLSSRTMAGGFNLLSGYMDSDIDC